MEFYYETHMHTAEVSKCAVSSAAEQVRQYKDKGYTGIIVTDHFINGNSSCPTGVPWDITMKCFYTGYKNAKKAGDECGLDVFFGWEYTKSGLDFLTYGLDLDFLLAHPDIDKLTIEQYSAVVHECGGYIAQAHPFREAFYIPVSGPVDARLLDGIEVFNSSDSFETNNKAQKFAKQNNLFSQAGSDSHGINHPLYTGIALKNKAGSIFDIINAIMANAITII